MKTSGLLAVVLAVAGMQNIFAAHTDDDQLLEACRQGNLELATNLLDHGASVEATAKDGSTPLMLAAQGHPDLVKLLLSRGAKIDAQAQNGDTAIGNACWSSDPASGALLIDAGADVNLGNQWKHTPLWLAAKQGCDSLVTNLIQHHATLDANGPDGTPLMQAVYKDKVSTVKLLLDAGADPKLTSDKPVDPKRPRVTLLSAGANTGDFVMVDLLLAHGLDINGPGEDGITPLINTAQSSRTKSSMILHLLEKGADANAQDNEGCTSLMWATLFQDAETLPVLLDHGAKLELKDNKGRTAFLWAGMHVFVPAMEVLFARGADINAADLKGETALTYAGNRGATEVVQRLREKGVKMTEVHVHAYDKPDPPLPPERSWALAVGAIYPQSNGDNPQMLGYDNQHSPARVRDDLKEWWGATDRKTFLEALDNLHTDGHGASYRTVGATLAAMNDTDFEAWKAATPEKKEKARLIRTQYLKWKKKTGIAWDLCRYANLVNMGYVAGYLSEDEAWEKLLMAARETQASFDSWQEMSDNFLDGREIWDGKRDPFFEACSQLLLDAREANSPWNQYPWKTELGTAAK